MTTLWWVLSFLGVSIVGMLFGELHESASIAARVVVNHAANRLPEKWREIRREEWLALLEAQEGMHIVRLTTAFGLYGVSVRTSLQARARKAATSAADAAIGKEGQQALAFFILVLIAAITARALQGNEIPGNAAQPAPSPEPPSASKLDLIDSDWERWCSPGYVDEDPTQWYRQPDEDL